jgi:cytochrome c biogenesis protein
MRKLGVAPRPLAPGQSIKLPDGDGTLTFTGYKQWISLAITYDPGQLPALVSAITAILGLILSFMVRRRRFFVRAQAGADGGTEVSLGGLARSDAAGGFEAEFAELTGLLQARHEGSPLPDQGPPPAAGVPDQPGPGDPVTKQSAIAAPAGAAGHDQAPTGQEGSDT